MKGLMPLDCWGVNIKFQNKSGEGCRGDREARGVPLTLATGDWRLATGDYWRPAD